jgi:hypothetical protein
MPRPVCIPCKREMKSLKVGEVVLLNAGRMTMRTGYKVEQVPYQAYHGDSFECEGCGAQIVTRYAEQPFWGAWMTDKPVPSDAIVVPEPIPEGAEAAS